MENRFQNGSHFEKKGYFDLLFTFSSHQGKDTDIPLADISRTYLAHPIVFFAIPIFQKLRIYHVWFFFDTTPDVDSCSAPFWSNEQITK